MNDYKDASKPVEVTKSKPGVLEALRLREREARRAAREAGNNRMGIMTDSQRSLASKEDRDREPMHPEHPLWLAIDVLEEEIEKAENLQLVLVGGEAKRLVSKTTKDNAREVRWKRRLHAVAMIEYMAKGLELGLADRPEAVLERHSIANGISKQAQQRAKTAKARLAGNRARHNRAN